MGLGTTITVQVNGNNGLPVSGANLWVINNYDDTILSTITNTTGRATVDAVYWWEGNNFYPVDSTEFNPFTIKALKDSDSTESNPTVGWNVKSFTLTLSGTEGSNPRFRKKIMSGKFVTGKIK
jgi:hypothetical protein